MRKKKVRLGAVRVGASVGVGASVTVAMNHRGGTCLITGVDAGLGVEALVGVLTIKVRREYYYKN